MGRTVRSYCVNFQQISFLWFRKFSIAVASGQSMDDNLPLAETPIIC
jgi:hypothetical protein